MIQISVIVPFYKGNQYLKRLFSSVEKVALKVKEYAFFEMILVNDSPGIHIELPETFISTRVFTNSYNIGIQGTRIHGLKYAKGDWVIFLDQDDELVEEGFVQQIKLTRGADVVVGNGIYIMGNINKVIFNNRKCMEYVIKEQRFIEIRNLIPSPGLCLIKKNKIPSLWVNKLLTINGADDWFLWILLFKNGNKFECNSQNVYIHNDTNGNNLSADLEKMKLSSIEVATFLQHNRIISRVEFEKLINAINFKYYQDTRQLTIIKIIRYIKPIFNNFKYKIALNIYKRGYK